MQFAEVLEKCPIWHADLGIGREPCLNRHGHEEVACENIVEDGNELHCVAAPSLPGFGAQAGRMVIGPKGGSCGTAVYRSEPAYVTDILTDPVWDLYRDRMLPYGIRSVCSRRLFTSEARKRQSLLRRQLRPRVAWRAAFQSWFLDRGIEAITPAVVRRKMPAIPAISLGGCWLSMFALSVSERA
jgi:hypothetical protein